MKKFISIAMSLILVVVIIPITNIEVSASTSGSCGVDVIWSFDATEGTLTISGSGAMMDFNKPTTWDGNCSKIINVVIENDVTSIGKNAFSICESLMNIYIPLSVIKIEENAFEESNNLINVYYEGSNIDWNNFFGNSLNSIFSRERIKFNQTSIHECSFGQCKIINDPTCISEGKKIKKCSCGKEETETIPATGKHNYEWKDSIEATCTEPGIQTQNCTICNHVGESKNINNLYSIDIIS